MWSSENAGGLLDRDAEIELWTKVGHIKVKVTKGADIRRLDSLNRPDFRSVVQARMELDEQEVLAGDA